MEMKAKVTIGVFVVLLGVIFTAVFGYYSGEQNTKEAIAIADEFVAVFYTAEEDISEAYTMVSEAFKAIQSKAMAMKIREATGNIVGRYVDHGNPLDVTKALAPEAPSHVRLVKFDVVFEQDEAGAFLVTMIKEGGKWKVHGFNVNSPLIMESQMSSSFD